METPSNTHIIYDNTEQIIVALSFDKYKVQNQVTLLNKSKQKEMNTDFEFYSKMTLREAMDLYCEVKKELR